MRRRLWSMLLLVLLADGCTDYSTTAPDIASVTVTPSSVTLVGVGAEAMLAATVLSSEGQSGLWGIEWTNSNPSVVELVARRAPNSTSYFTPRAHVRAVGPGSATITAAAYGGVTADAFIEVVEVSEYRMSPVADTLRALGDTVRLLVEGQAGEDGWIPAAGFTWNTLDLDVALVDRLEGLVTAVGNGVATFTAHRGTHEVTASITVAQEAEEITSGLPQSAVTLEALGDTVRFSVEGRDSNGYPVANDLFGWRSDDEAVAVVESTGLVVAVGNGSATISATSGAQTASARVTVAQKIESVRLTPRRDTLRALGDTVRLVAEHADANGHPVAGLDLAFAWSSSDASVASVDGTGMVTAIAEGTVVITARSAGTGLSATTDLLAWFPSDRDILVALYSATNGLFWNKNDNWMTDVPLDSWQGVETDSDGRVVRLDLPQSSVYGRIPPELGYLSQLRELNLARNRLTGVVPTELGRLANLRSLDLSGNRLAGEIPKQLGALGNLEELNLSQNSLETIPPELGALTNLASLNLSRNRLLGEIPQPLTDLLRLRILRLNHNLLTGSIPPELGNLTNLVVLTLGQNRLIGTIPRRLGDLANLHHLAIGPANQLTGSIPPELGNLGKLRVLGLWGLDLTGSIPPELGRLSNLEVLQLHVNELTGPVPAWLGNLEKLTDLDLGLNALTGPIPPELGNLTKLRTLTLFENRLTGTLPPELGNLTGLTRLLVNANDLAGRIPLEFVAMSRLFIFNWTGSKLCAPLDPEFQEWLESIRVLVRGPDCQTDALVALYRAAGGERWTNATNWLTDEPVPDWHGVTVDESGRVTALALRDNGLAGTLPAQIGSLVNLERLDLRDNRLSREVPGQLGELAQLRQLYLSGNRFGGRLPAELGNLGELTILDLARNQLTGAIPSSFADLSQLSDFQWQESGLCAPRTAWFQVWLSTISDHSGGANCASALRLSVSAAHVNQAAQNLAGGVPLIAGRTGLLRVFATADQANEHQPRGQATFYLDGREVHRTKLEFTSERGIPEDTDSDDPDQYFRAAIPGEVLSPGVEMVVEVDPDSIVPRAAGSMDRFPAKGRLALDVRELPRMGLTVVPVLALENPDSSVLEWVSGMGPGHPAIEYVTHVLPVGEYVVNIREPFIRSGSLEGFEDWYHFFDDISLLKAMDNGIGYYYGVVSVFSAVGGLGGPNDVAVGKPNAGTMAHEIGHIMGLGHAPCGFLFTWDFGYPYPDGTIGTWGYDARGDSIVPPSTYDVMSYCDPAWISDYYFNRAMLHRLETASVPPRAAAAPRANRLLLWGGTSPEGELRLNPAFSLDMAAQLPTRQGPYSLEGFGTDGTREFSLDFEMDELSHGGGSFLFAIPLEEEWLGSLDRVVLTGPEGRAELNAASNQAVALVLNRDSGRLHGVLRGEDAVGAATAVAAEAAGAGRDDPGTRILVSFGLPGRRPD